MSIGEKVQEWLHQRREIADAILAKEGERCELYRDHRPFFADGQFMCKCGLTFIPLRSHPIVVNVTLPYIKRSTEYFTTFGHDINSLKEKLKMNRAVFGVGKGDKYWDSAIAIIEKHYGLSAEHESRI